MAGKATEQKIAPLTVRGLERRIKLHLTSRRQEFAVITTPGLEEVTSREVEELEGVSVTGTDHGIVACTAPFDAVYLLNLHCRTATRVLLRIGSFTARSYPELYDKMHRLRWELYTGFYPELSISTTGKKSRLHHTGKIRTTAFDAIQAYMLRMGVRKAASDSSPHTVFVRLHDDICTVSIDTTGTMLHKRGSRPVTGTAPLRETIAAAMLRTSNYTRFKVIADPCCGSGVLVIEALHMLSGTPPGVSRDFAFSSWPSFNTRRWEYLRRKAVQHKAVRLSRVYAGDIDPRAISRVRKNIDGLILTGDLPPPEIRCEDCTEFNKDGALGRSGLIVSNLPFGKRITTDDGVEEFYRRLGTALRANCAGWSFGFLVADSHFERHLGIPCTTSLQLLNGGLKVRYCTGKVPGPSRRRDRSSRGGAPASR